MLSSRYLIRGLLHTLATCYKPEPNNSKGLILLPFPHADAKERYNFKKTCEFMYYITNLPYISFAIPSIHYFTISAIINEIHMVIMIPMSQLNFCSILLFTCSNLLITWPFIWLNLSFIWLFNWSSLGSHTQIWYQFQQSHLQYLWAVYPSAPRYLLLLQYALQCLMSSISL